MKQILAPMNRRSLVGGAVCGTLIPSAVQAGALAGVQDEVLTDALSAALNATLNTTGAVALGGAVWRNSQSVWQGQAGRRNFGTDTPIGHDDLWHLGSNTKAMTAALWARLIEQGKVVRDMPVADAVAAGRMDIRVHEGWHNRTVEDFMRHRAGLLDPAYINFLWLFSSQADKRPLPEQRLSLAKAILEAAPEGPLGTYAYGNANYILAGALIEAVTGEPWEAVMQRDLFTPLGITSAGFGAPQGDQPQGHARSAAGPKPVLSSTSSADNPAALGPAGTVHMSLADYGRFLDAMMVPGWLSQDSLDYLHTALSGEGYALGWGALGARPWAKGPVLMHTGSNTMWFAVVVVDPVGKLAVVTVSNDGHNGENGCMTLLGEIIKNLSPTLK